MKKEIVRQGGKGPVRMEGMRGKPVPRKQGVGDRRVKGRAA